MKTISIIGTAGRGEVGEILNKKVYHKMVQTVAELIKTLFKEDIILVSGGAAWSDHIAVDLYLIWNDFCEKPDSIPVFDHKVDLILHLPTEFNFETTRFQGNKVGTTANYYHDLFSKALGYDTLYDIFHAKATGATVTVSNGFFARNTEVAKSNIIIAITNSPTDQPADGGTKDTWNKAKKETLKIHISLQDIINSE